MMISSLNERAQKVGYEVVSSEPILPKSATGDYRYRSSVTQCRVLKNGQPSSGSLGARTKSSSGSDSASRRGHHDAGTLTERKRPGRFPNRRVVTTSEGADSEPSLSVVAAPFRREL